MNTSSSKTYLLYTLILAAACLQPSFALADLSGGGYTATQAQAVPVATQISNGGYSGNSSITGGVSGFIFGGNYAMQVNPLGPAGNFGSSGGTGGGSSSTGCVGCGASLSWILPSLNASTTSSLPASTPLTVTQPQAPQVSVTVPQSSSTTTRDVQVSRKPSSSTAIVVVNPGVTDKPIAVEETVNSDIPGQTFEDTAQTPTADSKDSLDEEETRSGINAEQETPKPASASKRVCTNFFCNPWIVVLIILALVFLFIFIIKKRKDKKDQIDSSASSL